MYLCSPVDDNSIIYLFRNEQDRNPYLFFDAFNYPTFKNSEFVEIEDTGNTDDDGASIIDEVEIMMIPTNSYKLINFKTEVELRRFHKTVEKYYLKGTK